MKKINILLADTQEIVRAGLRFLLKQTQLYRIIGEATTSEQTLSLASTKKPDMIILDTQALLPDEINVIITLRKLHPGLRIVIVTNIDDEQYFRNAVEYGANGYFLKSASSHDILDGLELIMRGEQYFGLHIVRKLIEESILSRKESRHKQSSLNHKLTNREIEILRNITLGLTNVKIAEKLFISDRTVHNHRNNLMRKLDVHNTADMVRVAIEAGLLDEYTN